MSAIWKKKQFHSPYQKVWRKLRSVKTLWQTAKGEGEIPTRRGNRPNLTACTRHLPDTPFCILCVYWNSIGICIFHIPANELANLRHHSCQVWVFLGFFCVSLFGIKEAFISNAKNRPSTLVQGKKNPSRKEALRQVFTPTAAEIRLGKQESLTLNFFFF